MRRTRFALLAGAVVVAGCGSSSSSPSLDGSPAPDAAVADAPVAPPDATAPVDAAPPDAAGPDADLGPENSGTHASGVAVAAFAASATLGPAGGTLSLAGGPSLEIPAAATGATVAFGLRPAASPPPPPTDGRQVLGGWYDVATDVNDLVLAAGKPARLSFPVTPPSGATAPALHVVARMADGVLYPIDGAYDAGRFTVELPGLPPFCTMAVVHLPGLVRATLPAGKPGARLALWPSVDFSIDYDGNAITLEQARKVLTFADTAAEIYSEAGLKEPFLYRAIDPAGPRWRLHLVPGDGSYFDSNHDPAAADAEQRFGRLYVDVTRIGASRDEPLGSLQASIAHEMLHAIFHSYAVPSRCYDLVQGGVTYCYPSARGWDEGIATAVGTFIDQDQAIPRRSEAKLPLSAPVGSFRTNAKWLAYSNQDFIVYVLRKAGLAGVRTILEGLAATPDLPASGTSWQMLDAYLRALEARGAGTGEGFLAFYTGYVVDRGYVHGAAGRIWPDEPVGGGVDRLDPTLFGPVRAVAAKDCTTLDGVASCKVSLSKTCPMCAYVVTADLAAGVGVPADRPAGELILTATADGSATLRPALAAFGETGGAGGPGSRVVAIDAGAVLAGMLVPHGAVRVLALQQGAPNATLNVKLAFRPVADVFKMTRAGLKMGYIDQLQEGAGGPLCTASSLARRVMYFFDTTSGQWSGTTYSGGWDQTFPAGSFGGHRRSQGSLTLSLDATGTQLLSFTLDSTLTGYYDDPEGTISTDQVHISWRGGPLPLTPGGIYELSYWKLMPISDAVVDLTDVYSSNNDPCLTRVAKNIGVEGGGIVVGLSR